MLVKYNLRLFYQFLSEKNIFIEIDEINLQERLAN